jgi:rubredoxin
MEIESKQLGEYFWEYRNKDGSKDKRTKSNFQYAAYNSYWKCNECNAMTHVVHFANKYPSVKNQVAGITLKSNGSGVRLVSDWVSKKGTAVDVNKANRKNNH